MKDLEWVFSEEDDRIEPPYEVDEVMLEKYVNLITHLAGLMAKGVLDYEFTPPDQNYASHAIYVTWRADAKGFVEAKRETMEKIASLFNDMETFAFGDDIWNMWQFTCTIYREKA